MSDAEQYRPTGAERIATAAYSQVRHSDTAMSTSTVGSKGQVVIPADVRADLKIDAGTRVEFVKTASGWLLKPATRPVTALKGILPARSNSVTVEEMNRAIRARAVRDAGKRR